jgi:CBS domain-containing protein
MKVREAMAKTISTASPTATVEDVALMMRDEDCGFIPVVDDTGHVLGVVTDRDIVMRCLAEGHEEDIRHEAVEHVMTKAAWTVRPDDDIEAAAHEMAVHHIRRLPVVEDERIVGVLSYGNLEQALHAEGAAASEATLGVTEGA